MCRYVGLINKATTLKQVKHCNHKRRQRLIFSNVKWLVIQQKSDVPQLITIVVMVVLSPAHTSNNVEATFYFVERTQFQRKTRSTLLPFLATKSNVASTLLLVWTGL